MEQDDFRISVALVTRNRPESLRRCLASLRQQGSQPYEVLVSDDSDAGLDEQTRRVAEEFGARYFKGPRRGLYANRNFVALQCKGSHIRTMDDDHEFPVNHWQDCERAVRLDPSSVWIIGEYPSTWVPAAHPPHLIPGELAPGGYSVHTANPDDTYAIADGASIYPAFIFSQGVRYSEEFKFGASYLEFGARLKWHGYRIRAFPQTYVIHHYDEATRSFIDAVHDYSSRLFAGYFLTFVYQRSAKNVLLYLKSVTRYLIAHPITVTRSIRNILPRISRHFAMIRQERANLVRQGNAGEIRPRAERSSI